MSAEPKVGFSVSSTDMIDLSLTKAAFIHKPGFFNISRFEQIMTVLKVRDIFFMYKIIQEH